MSARDLAGLNLHSEGAVDAMLAVGEGRNVSEAQALAVIQAQSTLALAYEARTANLIALYTNPATTMETSNGNKVTWSPNEETVGDLLQRILERLGVDENTGRVKS